MSPISKIHDAVIVGGGPAGTATALNLLQAGLKPVLIEKESFPRYHIGESLTGECGACLRRLGMEEKLVAEKNPVKWGVTVWGANGKNQFWVPVAERTEEGKIRETWTWQVRRSRFDQLLLDTAIERGLDYRLGEAKEPIVQDGVVKGLRYVTPKGNAESLDARLVIDASGQGTFLANKGVTSPKIRGRYDRQLAVFSQINGATRDPGDAADNTLIFYQRKHHWSWFIPLDSEAVSVGVVVPSDYFSRQKKSKQQFLRDELKTLNPQLAWRIPDTPFVEEVRGASNYSYHVDTFTGKGFLCVGDSHRFIDPIFSFGLFFAVKEAEISSRWILRYLDGKLNGAHNPFQDYQEYVDRAQDIIQTLMDCFWGFPLAFLRLVHAPATWDQMIDMFAGRLYGDVPQQSTVLQAMRKLLAEHGQESPHEAAVIA